VYIAVAIKLKPHHDLAAVQAKFAEVNTLEITRAAVEGARALGYSLEDIVEAVQALERGDFIKSETAHNPPNSRIWHDTYNMPWDDRWLYLKFAGETLIAVRLTSFKEVAGD
jgi:motility quorum-sensing regulator/GCU-specific mRNA interferase toxin